MNLLKYFIVFLGIFLTTVTSRRPANFYRRDYTYIPEYDAFYKLHWNTAITSWEQSFLTCENEGATLFYPDDSNNSKVVSLLTQALQTPTNITDVFIGIHNKFNPLEFVTVDGHPAPRLAVSGIEVCILMDSETGEYKPIPCTKKTLASFICQRLDKKPCPTIDLDYIYSKTTNKCYKVNKTPQSWDEAMQTCYMEGGVLTVEQQPTQIHEIRSKMDNQIEYFIGIRDLFYNGNFYTVKGKKVDSDKIITQNEHDETRSCVSARPYNNDIFSTKCYDEMPFVCEMDANN